MNQLTAYIFTNPFFGICFLLSTIPFWVPLVAVMNGGDPVLMGLVLLLTVMSRAYVDAEIEFANPLEKIYEYLLVTPIKVWLKLVVTIILLNILTAYAVEGEPIDRGIAAVSMIFAMKVLWLRPSKSPFTQIRGLTHYRIISFFGGLLVMFLWLSFFGLDVSIYEKVVIALTAMLVSALMFFKLNEGLI